MARGAFPRLTPDRLIPTAPSRNAAKAVPFSTVVTSEMSEWRRAKSVR
jgi:hypothetical protein